jgi:hypothetical protein
MRFQRAILSRVIPFAMAVLSAHSFLPFRERVWTEWAVRFVCRQGSPQPLEEIMLRKMSFLSASVMILFFCMPGHSQDSPSLGDLARKLQKEKGNTPARKTITNDDIPSASVPASPVLGEVSNSKVPAKPGASATPPDELARVESLVNKIDSMDRATLMKAVLEGVDFNFPGRSQWEQKMYAAKLAYVSQGRDLIQKAKQLSTSAQSLQGNKNPDDPHVKDLTNKLKELVQNGTRADAAFQAVILEGRDLAGQTSPH